MFAKRLYMLLVFLRHLLEHLPCLAVLQLVGEMVKRLNTCLMHGKRVFQLHQFF